MPRTTVGQAAQRIRRQLQGGVRFETLTLATEIDAATTTLSFNEALPPSMKAGAIVDVDLELMRVLTVNTMTKSCTVLRAWQDSDAEIHDAYAEVQINSRFTLWEIFDTMLSELQSWPQELFRVVETVTAVPGAGLTGLMQNFELPGEMSGATRVIAVRRHDTAQSYSALVNTTWPAVTFLTQREEGKLRLRLVDEVCSGSLYVQVALPMDTITEWDPTTDLITGCGLTPPMLDILDSGTKLRLMGDQENSRSARDAQRESRSAEAVPAGTAAKQASAMFAMYLRRRSEEMDRLRSLYPVRTS